MKSNECRHGNSKLGKISLIFFFERELEIYVDIEDEVYLVNNRSMFSDAIDDLPLDSSTYTRRIEFRCLTAKIHRHRVQQDKWWVVSVISPSFPPPLRGSCVRVWALNEGSGCKYVLRIHRERGDFYSKRGGFRGAQFGLLSWSLLCEWFWWWRGNMLRTAEDTPE